MGFQFFSRAIHALLIVGHGLRAQCAYRAIIDDICIGVYSGCKDRDFGLHQICLPGGNGTFRFVDLRDGLPTTKQRERERIAVGAVAGAGPGARVDGTQRVGVLLLLPDHAASLPGIHGDRGAEEIGLGLGQILVRCALTGARCTQCGAGLVGACKDFGQRLHILCKRRRQACEDASTKCKRSDSCRERKKGLHALIPTLQKKRRYTWRVA